MRAQTLLTHGPQPTALDALIGDLTAGVAAGDLATDRAVIMARAPNADGVVATWRAAAEAHGGTLIDVPCARSGMWPFAAVRPLLEQIVPVAAREAPEVLADHAAEVAAVHPRLLAGAGVKAPQPLERIANTPSERRSHRESERAFRIVHAVARLTRVAATACPSLSGGPLLVLLTDLDQADRPSLLTFRRLARWAHDAPARLLVGATLDPDGCPQVSELTVPADVAPLVNWRAAHRELLGVVWRQTYAVHVDLGGANAGDGEPTETGGTDADAGTTTADHEPVADADADTGDLDLPLAVAALDDLHGERTEQGCVTALRAMAEAGAALDFEAVLMLVGQVLAALDRRGDDLAMRAVTRAWRQRPADRYPALEFSTEEPTDRDDLVASAWKAAGFAHACLSDHEAASACYARALNLVSSPARRAELSMYLGLIAGKRLRRYREAEAHLQAGMAAIEGRTDDRCTLERSWLGNVTALLAFQQGHHDDAMRQVQSALRDVRPLRGSTATHLKINLVSNVSVLQETTGDLARAQRTWSSFAAFLRADTALFAKHFHFREGGLRARAGWTVDALTSYTHSYKHAVDLADDFHAEAAARACGYLSHALGRPDDAKRWYRTSAGCCDRLGDIDGMVTALTALAAVQADHDPAAADDTLASAAAAADPLGDPARARVDEVRRGLADGTAEALAAWREAHLRPPSSKLNRPFHLVNPYDDQQAR